MQHIRHIFGVARERLFLCQTEQVAHRTCPVDILIEKAQGCDILVHEAYCQAGLANMSELWRAN